jgi:hypothetical protein
MLASNIIPNAALSIVHFATGLDASSQIESLNINPISSQVPPSWLCIRANTRQDIAMFKGNNVDTFFFFPPVLVVFLHVALYIAAALLASSSRDAARIFGSFCQAFFRRFDIHFFFFSEHSKTNIATDCPTSKFLWCRHCGCKIVRNNLAILIIL